MKLNATYIKIRDKWWGLPLFLPSLILPIFAHINTFAHISSGEVFLFVLTDVYPVWLRNKYKINIYVVMIYFYKLFPA